MDARPQRILGAQCAIFIFHQWASNSTGIFSSLLTIFSSGFFVFTKDPFHILRIAITFRRSTSLGGRSRCSMRFLFYHWVPCSNPTRISDSFLSWFSSFHIICIAITLRVVVGFHPRMPRRLFLRAGTHFLRCTERVPILSEVVATTPFLYFFLAEKAPTGGQNC